MGPMYMCLHLYPLLAVSLKIQTCRNMNYIKQKEKKKKDKREKEKVE